MGYFTGIAFMLESIFNTLLIVKYDMVMFFPINLGSRSDNTQTNISTLILSDFL